MHDQPISRLRQRMLEAMAVRNLAEKTRHDYIRHVKSFAAFLGVQPSSMNSAVSALRFFFGATLDRPDMERHLAFVREPRKIPVILSPPEMGRLLEAAPGPNYKAAMSAAYSAGFRAGGAEGLRRRFQAHAAAHRAGQRTQGSPCQRCRGALH